MSRTITRDMTTGNPIKLILQFSVPMLIGNLFQQFYNMVDSIVVGKFVSKDALAAVGATSSSIFLIISMTFGLAMGISIVVSQYFGAGDYEKVRKSIASAVYILFVSAIVMGMIGFCQQAFAGAFGHSMDVIDQSEIYMKICFIGIFRIVSYNGIAAILRALGEFHHTLIFLIVASLLNVVLDLVFVVFLKWDVPGVAIATIISQIVSGEDA